MRYTVAMQSNITLIRAIGSEFIIRKYRSLVLVLAIVAVAVLALMIWLITLSAWWWLLAAPVISLVIIGVLVALLVRVIIRAASPVLTKQQTKDVKDFVDKLERVADNLQTPAFIILFRVVRDTVRPRDKTFIQSMAEDSTTLHTDFATLQRKFAS